MRNVESINSSPSADMNIETIARLLMEYTTRLRDLVRRADGYRYRRMTLIVMLACALGVVGSLALWAARFATNGFVVATPFIVTFLASLLAGAVNIFLVDVRRERVLRGDIRIAARQLKQVVRLGVQIQEYGVSDSAIRLDLELKLTDALSTLHYADYDTSVDYATPQTSAR